MAKRTTGLLKPEDAPKIEQATREHFSEWISGYGTDALRFTFASLATQGPDIRFDLGRVGRDRNFWNKLGNAARFVIMTVDGQDTAIERTYARRSAEQLGAGNSYQLSYIENEEGAWAVLVLISGPQRAREELPLSSRLIASFLRYLSPASAMETLTCVSAPESRLRRTARAVRFAGSKLRA